MGILGTTSQTVEHGYDYTAASPDQNIFTVCMWLRWPGTTSFGTVFVMCNASTETCYLADDGSSNHTFILSGATNNTPIMPERWYFVSIVRAALNDTKLYLDCLLDTSDTTSRQNVNGRYSFFHDLASGSTGQNAAVQIEHARMWDGIALNPQELYTEMQSPYGDPIVHVQRYLWAYYKFQTVDDTYDYSGNGRHLTKVDSTGLLTGAPNYLPRMIERRRTIAFKPTSTPSSSSDYYPVLPISQSFRTVAVPV